MSKSAHCHPTSSQMARIPSGRSAGPEKRWSRRGPGPRALPGGSPASGTAGAAGASAGGGSGGATRGSAG
eukprot:6816424-Lingulodinium_polyedra.AAC.1